MMQPTLTSDRETCRQASLAASVGDSRVARPIRERSETPVISAAKVSARPVTWASVIGSITLSAVAAFLLYAAAVKIFIDPYILKGSDAGRVLGVYRGYDRIKAEQAALAGGKQLVLFWGSSMIREAVDAKLVEAAAPRFAAYNLGVSGDLPNRRLVELPRVRELHPQHVVIGVSYRDLFNSGRAFEDQVAVLPSTAYTALPEEFRGLLDARSRELAQRSEWSRFWWKRKFTLPALFWSLGVPDRSNPVPAGFAENFHCPNVYSKSLKPSDLEKLLADRGRKYPPYSDAQPLPAAATTGARSLAATIRALQAQGAQIVLVNMPLHPLLNELVPAEHRQSYWSFLQSLASSSVTVTDFQDKLGAEQFIDLLHLNAAGRAAFSRAMGELLTAAEPLSSSRREEAHSSSAESGDQSLLTSAAPERSAGHPPEDIAMPGKH